MKLLIYIAVAMFSAAPAALAQPTFDPSHPQGLSINTGTGTTAVLDENHGGIIQFADSATDTPVGLANLYGPWVVRFADGHWMDAATFGAGNPARTSTWTWDQPTGTLTYHLVSADSHTVDVTYSVTPGPKGLAFTLVFTNNSAFDIKLLSFPAHLGMPRTQVDYARLPYIEGVELRQSFFQNSTIYSASYPGPMFADFASFSVNARPINLFFAHDPLLDMIPAKWQLLYDIPNGDLVKVHHDHTRIIEAGETFTPPTFYVMPDTPMLDAMDHYWTANQHDTAPKLADKLTPEVFDTLAGAVLFKEVRSGTFDQLATKLGDIPEGNIYHLVSFWPWGFDRHYPDYLPPDPALGTTQRLASLVSLARTHYGHLVMPYTNPTWWDDDSPTVTTLGLGIAAEYVNNTPVWETYNGDRDGIVVSPYHPDVIAQQDQNRTDFTVTVPCDFLFEDQVGVRGPRTDYNPAAPTVNSYSQGLINLAQRTSESIGAWTEGGFDRLAPHEIGFANSANVGWHGWADSQWRPFPMAPLWAHDQMVFTTHNLANVIMTNNHKRLAEDLANGYSLSFTLFDFSDLSWVEYLDSVQKNMVAPLLGVDMTSFAYLSDDLSTTTFADGKSLLANRGNSTHVEGYHTLAGPGFLMTDAEGFLAGRVTHVNGQTLTGGVHTIILEPSDPLSQTRRLDHPEGPSTSLLIGWAKPQAPQFVAVLEDGTTVDQPISLIGNTLVLSLFTTANGQPIDHFLLVSCAADLNNDGFVDAGDISGFISLFLNSDPAADFNNDGFVDSGDIGVFITLYLAGC